MHRRTLPAMAGLAVVFGLLAPVGLAAASSASPHTVPLDCSSDGGDSRTTYDASVQPGVIVPDFSGFPFSPTTYTAYGFNRQEGKAEIIASISEVDSTDHLVAAWMNSTSCFVSIPGDGDFSRNAWIADATGHVFGEGELSGPPANNFGDASGLPLNKPMVGMTPTSNGQGYWLVASDGGIFTYGDAQFS